jgi:hypothetical protein
MSRNDIRAIAARDCISGPLSRRLHDIGAVSPWGYVSGHLSRNDICATAARDCISGPPARLCNVALRLSSAYEDASLNLSAPSSRSGCVPGLEGLRLRVRRLVGSAATGAGHFRRRALLTRPAALKARKDTGDRVRKIAKRFGVDPGTVQRISSPLRLGVLGSLIALITCADCP